MMNITKGGECGGKKSGKADWTIERRFLKMVASEMRAA